MVLISSIPYFMQRMFTVIQWITYKICNLSVKQSLFYKYFESIAYTVIGIAILLFLWWSGILASSVRELFVS